MPADRPVIFYDVEASGLYEGSYPIEVGWAIVRPDGSITTDAMLITPISSWIGWSSEAEEIHGITRHMLSDLGRPIAEVVDRLDQVFCDYVVLSDYPPADEAWTDRLYAAAGRTRRFRIADAEFVLNFAASTAADHHWLAAHLSDTRLHRADADARVLAEAYVELMSRRAQR